MPEIETINKTLTQDGSAVPTNTAVGPTNGIHVVPGEQSDDATAFTSSTGIILFSGRMPIPGTAHRLKDHIIALWEQTKDGLIVRSEELDEEAFGRALHDASMDFLTSLSDRLESLNRRAGHLSSRDEATREKLARLIES